MKLIVKHFLPLLAVVALSAPLFAAPALDAHTPTLTKSGPVSAPGSKLPLVPFAAPLVGMAIRIKDTGTLAQKFVTRAGAASGDYTSGVQAAGQDWQANALASEQNYEQGVQQSIADKRFSKGIQDAGASKYVANATTLGPQRYQTGVAQAQGAWAKGVQPHLDAMKSANLPPRGPKGSPQNQTRAQAIATLNRSIKLGK